MRSRPLLLVLIVLLAVAALRPDERVDALLERALGPSRFLAEATWPLARLGRVELSAGDADTARRTTSESAASARLLERWYASALPRTRELVAGRRLVPAEVLGRAHQRRDQLLVRPWSLDGMVPGLPAVVREAYVGRIAEVDAARGLVRVDLVTGRDFHVGARVTDEQGEELSRLVVGGVATDGRKSRLDAETWLAAHHPSRLDVEEALLGGRVVVDELLPEVDPHGALARGYSLGRFAAGVSEGDWRVEPELDYLHGLASLVLLCPSRGADDALLPEPPPHPLAEPLWTPARAFSAGDPSPWRSSVQVDRGAGDGLAPGGAVVRGARLVGRLGAVSAVGAEVRLLADPGLEVTALAELEDAPLAPPTLLGRLVSQGADEHGRPLFLWHDVRPLEHTDAPEPRATRRARLITAAGDLGLPGGLWIGDADVPVGSSGGAGHVLVLHGAEDALRGAARVWLRQTDPRVAGLEGAP